MSTDAALYAPPEPFEPPAWVREGLGRPTGKGIRIAVVDSGWDRACDDPRVLPGVGLVDPADDLAMLRTDDDHDRVGHGTACIHQILRIAPDARVLPVRVFGNDLETSPGTLQAGILWALEQDVQVVNLSLGTTLEGTLHPLYAACERARRAGIVVVAAGHNSRSWSYPAIFENVIGVSADRFVSPYEYRYLPDEAMEVQAWGVEQPVVWLGGEVMVKHGTSFAAPNVAGIVALMKERYPEAKLEDIRELLKQHAINDPDAVPPAAPELAVAGPAVKPPAAKRAPRKRATVEAPAAEASAAKKPASKRPPRKRSVAEAPATEAPVAEKPAPKRAPRKRAAEEAPIAEAPVAESPPPKRKRVRASR